MVVWREVVMMRRGVVMVWRGVVMMRRGVVMTASMMEDPAMTASMMEDPVMTASTMEDPAMTASMTPHREKTGTSDEESDGDSTAETGLSRERLTSDSASSPLLSAPERGRMEEMQESTLDPEALKQSQKPC